MAQTQPRLKVVNEHDPFKGENSGYSRDNFYVGAVDGSGGSETKYLKMAGSVLGQIGELVSSKLVPAYRTEADFIRDAVIHRLHDVNEMVSDSRIESVVNRMVMLDRIRARQVELAEFNSIVTNHEEAMQACVANEDTELLGDLISDAESDWEALRPSYQKRLDIVLEKYRVELAKLKDK